MRSPRLFALLLPAALVLQAPAWAQQGPPRPIGPNEAPPPPLDLGPLLQQARTSQAIDRVLGDRFFHVTHPRGEALLRVRVVAVEDDPPTLAYDALLRVLDAPGAVSTQILLGWDGRMLACRTGLQGAGVESITEGKVVGDKLVVTRETKGQETKRETFDWHPVAIPAPIAMFVLPSLIDQGVPPTGALFMQFDEQGFNFGARRVHGVRPDLSRGPGQNLVEVRLAVPPHTLQFTAHLSPAGHVTQLVRGKGQGNRIVQIGAQIAEKLMDRVVDFVPDPAPPGAGSGAGSGTETPGGGADDSGAESGAEPPGVAPGGSDQQD